MRFITGVRICLKKYWRFPVFGYRVEEERRPSMFFFRFVLSFVSLVSVSTFAAEPPVIKKVSAPFTSPSSGPEMFKQYCASCHGADAKGHGPAAAALKVPPPDLTLLAKQHNGKFPEPAVYSAIWGDNVTAHGSSGMPVWGAIFHQMANNSPDNMQEAGRMSVLCRYIQSLQQK
jgi:mono/diheme cytochrome c family protein